MVKMWQVSQGEVQSAWGTFSRRTGQWFSSLPWKLPTISPSTYRKGKSHFRTHVAVPKFIFIFSKDIPPQFIVWINCFISSCFSPLFQGTALQALNTDITTPLLSLHQVKCFHLFQLLPLWNWFELPHHSGQCPWHVLLKQSAHSQTKWPEQKVWIPSSSWYCMFINVDSDKFFLLGDMSDH